MSAAAGPTQAQAQRAMERWQEDPELYFRDALGADPWPRQIQIAESVRDNEVTAVPSCHSSGKSFVAARIVLWFLQCFYRSLVITTAPSERQVKHVLWAEIGRAFRDATMRQGGHLTTMQLKVEDDWYALGFTAPDWDETRFQGYHGPHLLIVKDEAAGISRSISEQIDSLMAGGHCRLLEIGNPTDPYSSFHDQCEDEENTVIPISAFDTPNFTEFGITETDLEGGTWATKVGDAELPYPELITPQWAATRLRRWGKKSPSYLARVRGEFPEETEGSYIGKEMSRAKAEDRIVVGNYDPSLPVDTAWDIGHDDETAIWFVQRSASQVRLVDYHEDRGHGLPHYKQVLDKKREEHGISYGRHFAPHDMGVTEWGSGVSRIETAKKLGLRFEVQPRMAFADQVEAARNLMALCWFDAARCARGITVLRAWKKAQDPKGNFLPNEERNEFTHGGAAFRTLALGLGKSPYQEKNRPHRPTRRPSAMVL